MIAARSSGLPAIAVSGTYAWRSEWAPAFAGRRVTVVMDCDPPGREAADRIASDLAGPCVPVLDLDESRNEVMTSQTRCSIGSTARPRPQH